MSPQRLFIVFVFLYFFFEIKFQVEGTLSSSPTITKTRRTQSIRPSTSNRNTENTHIKSDSLSSFLSSASDTSLTRHKVADSHPIASTSVLKEVDLHPLIGKTKSTGFINSANLRDTSVPTHNGVNIIPTRDGVFARVRTALKYAGIAVAGSAIAAGGFVYGQEINNTHNNNTNQTSNTNIVTSSHSVITTDTNIIQRTRNDFDNIENHL